LVCQTKIFNQNTEQAQNALVVVLTGNGKGSTESSDYTHEERLVRFALGQADAAIGTTTYS
jgi:hypothetical protein